MSKKTCQVCKSNLCYLGNNIGEKRVSSDPDKKTFAGHLISLSSMLMEEMSKLISTATDSGTASPEQDNDTSIDVLEHLLRLRLVR